MRDGGIILQAIRLSNGTVLRLLNDNCHQYIWHLMNNIPFCLMMTICINRIHTNWFFNVVFAALAYTHSGHITHTHTSHKQDYTKRVKWAHTKIYRAYGGKRKEHTMMNRYASMNNDCLQHAKRRINIHTMYITYNYTSLPSIFPSSIYIHKTCCIN